MKIWSRTPLSTTVRLVVLTFILCFLLALSLGTASLGTPCQVSQSEHCRQYQQIYDEIWQLVDQHFLYQDRLKDWSKWRHKYDVKLQNTKRLNESVSSMLDSLKDNYTFYRDSDATSARRAMDDEKGVVTFKKVGDGIGYVRISGFCSKLCVHELRQALQELSDCHGYILDLQNNSGGCVDIAFEVFAMFSPSGDFVSMKGTSVQESKIEKWYLDKDQAVTESDGEIAKSPRLPNYTGNKPIVVLVDGDTRSAAEMMAGALQDNGRAIVLGKKTFGKGIVQRVWDLPDNTSVKISAAFYYLPLGRSIHGVGVKPDIEIEAKEDKEPIISQACHLIRARQIAQVKGQLKENIGF